MAEFPALGTLASSSALSSCLELQSPGVVVRSTERLAGKRLRWSLGWDFFSKFGAAVLGPPFICSDVQHVAEQMFLIFRPLYLTITARCLADMLPPFMALHWPADRSQVFSPSAE